LWKSNLLLYRVSCLPRKVPFNLRWNLPITPLPATRSKKLAAGWIQAHRIIKGIVVLRIIAAGIYGWEEYTRKVKDLEDVAADFSVQAPALITEFMTDEAAANKKYQNKIVAVQGMVK